MTNIKYGSNERTVIIDEHQSTLGRLFKYRDGKPTGTVVNRLKIRHPAEELTIEQLGQMVYNNLHDKTKVDPSFELDSSVKDGRAHYYVVECYTVIEKVGQ